MHSITTQDLYDRHFDEAGTILDARTAAEFAAGHVPGAINVPHDQLQDRLEEIPRDMPVYVHCAMGGRAQRAASVLEAAGYDVWCVVSGGMKDWVAQGLPVSK